MNRDQILRELDELPKRTSYPGETGVSLEDVADYVAEKLKERDRALHIIKGRVGDLTRIIGSVLD